MKRIVFIFGLVVVSIFLGAALSFSQNPRYIPARWVQDQDRLPIAKPKLRYEYRFSPRFEYQSFYQIERLVNPMLHIRKAFAKLGAKQEALNTNNFDEVADSSWFTNRMGRRAYSFAEIRRGPNQGSGPDMTQTLTVLSGKTSGVTPGLVIEDAKGDRYLIKFDPPGHPELSTAVEMIGTKFFHAFGYNVPENYLVYFYPSQLTLSPRATQKGRFNKKIPLREEDIRNMLRRVALLKSGQYRALASKFIPGKILGPFSFRGKRHDDPNDRIPHEHRRELRGYRVFSAFLNHNDAREANSLDTFLITGPEKQGYIKHYLIDFGGMLGSGSSYVRGPRHFGDQIINYQKILASTFSLGAYQPNWEKGRDPNHLSIGYFEAETFVPHQWKTSYPLPPFQNMTDRDAFWATKILMNFRNEHIAAIVKEAQYSELFVEQYITQTLIQRRDKIGRYWFSVMNPLDEFEIHNNDWGSRLQFDDLGITSGLWPWGSAKYRYRWRKVSDRTGLKNWNETTNTEINISSNQISSLKTGKEYILQLQTKRRGEKNWSSKIDVILEKRKGRQLQLLGLKRRY